ncbi:amidohydrolase family protein [Streptomyces gilvus]|uniref:amidohydrolase family protein n=1 Tax=Streptomyces gilvus TaxID=2920937 RepID=UPI001F0F6A39|nr:amidohydrolase family protein [Streptomyces sp. CME 23]MCH5675606.1 amidohydrolase family protein [Streptomyces sp. CME 23]
MILIRAAEVAGHRADVRLVGDRVAEIAPALRPRRDEEVIDANGGALLPGLVDHHVHLYALAAAAHSTPCGPPSVRTADGLRSALAAATTDPHGWIRGVGYHESVAGDLDSATLDRLHPDRPVRIQHRSGALWILNSRGAERLGLATADHPAIERAPDGSATGRLWRADRWIRSRLPNTSPPDLSAVGAQLARYGITAVTDATPDLEPAAIDGLSAAARSGALPQRVHVLGAPLHMPLPAPLTAGPYKIVLADSGLPDLDALTTRIRTVHTAGRAVAAHCVTREALVLLLAALEEAGGHLGDRIEHAALVPADLLDELADRRLRVVTQPGFLAHRGDDYRRDVPPDEHRDLYRCASLRAAGVPLALSSDAPYGPVNPWSVIRAAVARRTPSGAILSPAEQLSSRQALDAYLAPPEKPGGPPRRLRPGAPADLLLLDRPLTAVLDHVPTNPVLVTFIAGRKSTMA